MDWMEGKMSRKEGENQRKTSCVARLLSCIIRERNASFARKSLYITMMSCSLKN